MKNTLKISALFAAMLISASVYSQSDSLGMPGDNLDLKAVLSIFSKSSSIEDFERRLNSADSKVNNLDLNGDNQVDYLRVVDYGKDDFHSIVIQDPVSKSESQDVAVIEVVKKGDNTAHVQIVGDETLYGKDYIIEPDNQEPLNSTTDATSKKKKSNLANDDVYESGNSSTHVMINVWGWPSVTYLYAPSYSYWVSPWYYGYYPTWYSPWRPYGWHVYRGGFVGYNYGFYGYRRYHYAFPHVHSYYYGRRVSSGYVQKTAPHYGKRNSTSNNVSHRAGKPNTASPRNNRANRTETNSNSQNRTNQQRQNNKNTQRQRSETKERSNSNNRSNSQNKSQSRNVQKVNSAPRSSSSSGRSNSGSRSTGSNKSGSNTRGGR